jgi:hypothetical protein
MAIVRRRGALPLTTHYEYKYKYRTDKASGSQEVEVVSSRIGSKYSKASSVVSQSCGTPPPGLTLTLTLTPTLTLALALALALTP